MLTSDTINKLNNQLFWSDLHLNHNRDFIYGDNGGRNYNSVDTMNYDLLRKLRETLYGNTNVTDIWFLGDLAMSRDKLLWVTKLFVTVPQTINIHWKLGNHDNPKHVAELSPQFPNLKTYPMKGLTYVVDNVWVSHFPFQGTPHDGSGGGKVDEREKHLPFPVYDPEIFLLHGHTHSATVRSGPNSLHVGVDAVPIPSTVKQLL